MRDPDLVTRAQRAAVALERAWERWRAMHGLSAEPMPPVSSYVGYSIEEPWGRPRVVFGVDAREAELLAALLDHHECVGPFYQADQADPAEAGFGTGPAGSAGIPLGEARSRIPAQAHAAEERPRPGERPWQRWGQDAPADGPGGAAGDAHGAEQDYRDGQFLAGGPGPENGAADLPREDEARGSAGRAGDQRRGRRADPGRPSRRERRAASRQRSAGARQPVAEADRGDTTGRTAVVPGADPQAGRATASPAGRDADSPAGNLASVRAAGAAWSAEAADPSRPDREAAPMGRSTLEGSALSNAAADITTIDGIPVDRGTADGDAQDEAAGRPPHGKSLYEVTKASRERAREAAHGRGAVPAADRARGEARNLARGTGQEAGRAGQPSGEPASLNGATDAEHAEARTADAGQSAIGYSDGGRSEAGRSGNRHSDAGLAGLGLAGPDLGGPGPAGHDMPGTELGEPEFAGHDLVGTHLGEPEFAGHDLAGPGLGDADLAGPGLGDADLAGPGLAGLSMVGPDLGDPDFAGDAADWTRQPGSEDVPAAGYGYSARTGFVLADDTDAQRIPEDRWAQDTDPGLDYADDPDLDDGADADQDDADADGWDDVAGQDELWDPGNGGAAGHAEERGRDAGRSDVAGLDQLWDIGRSGGQDKTRDAGRGDAVGMDPHGGGHDGHRHDGHRQDGAASSGFSRVPDPGAPRGASLSPAGDTGPARDTGPDPLEVTGDRGAAAGFLAAPPPSGTILTTAPPRQARTARPSAPSGTETIAAELAGWAAGELPGQASARLAAWAAIGGVPAPGYRHTDGSDVGAAGVGTERAR